MKDFKYGWRFTDEKYSLFSDDELSEMKIISKENVSSFWSKVCDNEMLPKCSFVNRIISREMPVLIGDCGWGDESTEKLTEVLLDKSLNVNNDDFITILYDSETAIGVAKGLFCRKWSDFCYPTDILLIKCNEKLFLYYEDTIYIY